MAATNDDRPILIRQTVLMLLAFCLLPWAAAFFAPAGQGTANDALFTLLYQSAFLLAFVLANGGQQRAVTKAPRAASLLRALAIALALYGTAMLFALLSGQSAQREARTHDIPTDVITCGLLVVVAMYEELLYRVFLVERLTRLAVGEVWAIVTSALVFAALHLRQGPAAALFALCAAVVLSLAFRRWKSVAVIAIAHACYNLAVYFS